MDPVFSDSPADHDDKIARVNPLDVTLFSQDSSGNDAPGPTEDQGFSQKTVIKDNAAVDRGNTALVPPMFHPFSDALKHTSRVKELRRNRPVVGGGSEAEDIGIENQSRSLSRPKGVSVDPNDPGKRSSIGIQGRGGVVGFHFEHQAVRLVECHHTCIVMKNRETPVLVGQLFPDSVGCTTDKCPE